MTEKIFGFDLLESQAGSWVQGELYAGRDQAVGDTEIERLFYHAIGAVILVGATEFKATIVVQDEVAERRIVESCRNASILIVRPQAQVGEWRVDFLFRSFTWGKREFQKIIVECDGHEFHERTKEQASRDRSRDRHATMSGVPIFRFTGSELWRDPFGCAQEFLQFAAPGLVMLERMQRDRRVRGGKKKEAV